MPLLIRLLMADLTFRLVRPQSRLDHLFGEGRDLVRGVDTRSPERPPDAVFATRQGLLDPGLLFDRMIARSKAGRLRGILKLVHDATLRPVVSATRES
jgi:hypothetical protein